MTDLQAKRVAEAIRNLTDVQMLWLTGCAEESRIDEAQKELEQALTTRVTMHDLPEQGSDVK